MCVGTHEVVNSLQFTASGYHTFSYGFDIEK